MLAQPDRNMRGKKLMVALHGILSTVVGIYCGIAQNSKVNNTLISD
jgi:hypothetical protein